MKNTIYCAVTMSLVATGFSIAQSYDSSNRYYVESVETSYSPEDQVIARKITDTLKGGWFSKGYETITFSVHQGNVELNGTVEKEEDRKKVEDAVRKIDGVRNIHNQISFSRTPAAKDDRKDDMNKYPQDRYVTPLDRKIATNVRDSLSSWFSSNPEFLAVYVDNGNVMIRGYVTNLKEREKITEKLKEVDGVRSINNQMLIRSKDADQNDYRY